MEGIKGRYHKNQPADNPIGIDIVYFISLLQLRYGFRISEILKSFRTEEDMEKYGVPVQMRSYFKKDTQSDKTYLIYILNYKNRNRIFPIDENGKILLFFPIEVCPVILTCDWMLVPSSISTLGPITVNGPMCTFEEILEFGSIIAVLCIIYFP